MRIVNKEFMSGARPGVLTCDKRGPLLTEAGPGGEDDATSAPRGERGANQRPGLRSETNEETELHNNQTTLKW